MKTHRLETIWPTTLKIVMKSEGYGAYSAYTCANDESDPPIEN